LLCFCSEKSTRGRQASQVFFVACPFHLSFLLCFLRVKSYTPVWPVHVDELQSSTKQLFRTLCFSCCLAIWQVLGSALKTKNALMQSVQDILREDFSGAPPRSSVFSTPAGTGRGDPECHRNSLPAQSYSHSANSMRSKRVATGTSVAKLSARHTSPTRSFTAADAQR